MQSTILVIDDQWSMQEYARLVLQTAGYCVLLANDTITGLSLARTEHPDAILMDSRIGAKMILQALRRDLKTASIPVILITLQPQDEELTAGVCASTSGFLQKPFQPPALLTAIEGMLNHAPMPIAV